MTNEKIAYVKNVIYLCLPTYYCKTNAYIENNHAFAKVLSSHVNSNRMGEILNAQYILANIRKHVQLNKEEISYFLSLIKPAKLDKKDFLLRQSERCDRIYFVNSGLLRSYSIGQDGKEATVMFAFKDWWITDMYSFVRQSASLTNIQAMENSEVLSLSKRHLEQLYVQIPKFEKFFRILMQNAYIREQYRVWENITLTAEEKYISFINKYPQIEQKVAQKYIASYLGITPEFLCAMKKRRWTYS